MTAIKSFYVFVLFISFLVAGIKFVSMNNCYTSQLDAVNAELRGLPFHERDKLHKKAAATCNATFSIFQISR